MRTKRRGTWLLASCLCACSQAAPDFVPAPPIPEGSFVVSVARRGTTLDSNGATFLSAEALNETPQPLPLEEGAERLWLVFSEDAIALGLRPRVSLEDLSRLRLHPPSGHDCGFGGDEISWTPSEGSVFRQRLSRLSPQVLVLGFQDAEFVERDLDTEPELGAYELEMIGDAEDCGSTAPRTLTPFNEGGVLPEAFSLDGRLVRIEDGGFSEMVEIHPVEGARHLLLSSFAMYVVPLGLRFDPEVHPFFTTSELDLPVVASETWRFRSALVEPSGTGSGHRVLVLVDSERVSGGADAAAALVEVALDATGFGVPTVRWYREQAGYPEAMVRDRSRRIVMIGRRGLVVTAASWDADFTELHVGTEDLRAIATGPHPRYPHVLASRAGKIFFGDLFGETPLQEHVPRTLHTVSQMVMNEDPESTRLWGAWRDGLLFSTDLERLEDLVEFEIELPRRAWLCAGAREGQCGRRAAPQKEFVGLTRLPGREATQLLALIERCSHPVIVVPDTGCVVPLGPGDPTFDAPRLRSLGEFGGVTWLGGERGQVYSLP